MPPRTRPIARLALATLVATLAVAGPALAALGDLDTTFGTAASPGVAPLGGTANTYTNAPARTAVIRPDGNSVVLVDDQPRAFRANGSPDPVFATAPFASVVVDGAPAVGTNLARQADGKLLVTVRSIGASRVVRLLPDGALDAAFGQGGVASVPTLSTSSRTFGGPIAVQPDGAIVLLSTELSPPDLFAARPLRLTATGSPDTALNAAAAPVLPTDGGSRLPLAVSILSDGRVVFSTTATVRSGPAVTVGRVLADGTPDASFGATGRRTVSVPGTDLPTDAAHQADGSMLVALTTGLVRITSTGTIDASFATSTGNVATYPNGAGGGQPRVALDNGFVVAGLDGATALVRYLADGRVDAAFGTDGSVPNPFTSRDRSMVDLVAGPLGIVGIGRTQHARWSDRDGFRFDVDPAVEVVAGTTGTVQATLERDPAYTAPVTLSTTTVTGITVSTAPTVLVGTTTAATVTVSVASTVAAGTYVVGVRALGAGQPAQLRNVTVTVPECGIRLSEISPMMAPGTSVTIGVTIIRTASCQGPATLAVEGLPATQGPVGSGFGTTFTPNPATGTTSALTVHAGRFVAPGDYPALVRATIGARSFTAPLNVEIVDLH